MAINVELWRDDAIVDGLQVWWELFEMYVLADDHQAGSPLVRRIDPYGCATFARGELPALEMELQRLSTEIADNRRDALMRIRELCRIGVELSGQVELRFLGD
ncbi:hypothetical protein [Aeromicrobium sp. CnD17-E]|uniref:hypothetical protein n=1 Tax=Aeromicrobium sp. CnD17-E TaxID=2954487 RepID=UPI00209714AA|nr:hypothetical protein [Aeromicrobium sp. CnD17-E]MCO7237612.1 hypothetical protein [Aeromicrobium sp. CnD17-E]